MDRDDRWMISYIVLQAVGAVAGFVLSLVPFGNVPIIINLLCGAIGAACGVAVVALFQWLAEEMKEWGLREALLAVGSIVVAISAVVFLSSSR